MLIRVGAGHIFGVVGCVGLVLIDWMGWVRPPRFGWGRVGGHSESVGLETRIGSVSSWMSFRWESSMAWVSIGLGVFVCVGFALLVGWVQVVRHELRGLCRDPRWVG